MSILAIAVPYEAVIANAVIVARPLAGLGVLAALLFVFRPLLTGLLRAALVVMKPRQSLEERSSSARLHSMVELNRMAREYDNIQPSLAAELRAIAARG